MLLLAEAWLEDFVFLILVLDPKVEVIGRCVSKPGMRGSCGPMIEPRCVHATSQVSAVSYKKGLLV